MNGPIHDMMDELAKIESAYRSAKENMYIAFTDRDARNHFAGKLKEERDTVRREYVQYLFDTEQVPEIVPFITGTDVPLPPGSTRIYSNDYCEWA